MKKGIPCFLFILSATLLNAQQTTGKQNIEKLCGCFNVEFKYIETFSPDPYYKYHQRDETSGGLELVLPVEMSDHKIVLQHLLVVSDTVIVKHWRENWTYEDPIIWKYQGDKIWTKETRKPEDVKGKWSQSVWEVSDAPRYQGASEWITTNGKTSWENTTDAPLPRREYSVRSDYNVLRRTNRIILSKDGWIHDQQNQKVLRKDGTDKILVYETGVNTYERTDSKACDAAKKYWERTGAYWAHVRTAWENYLAVHTTVTVKPAVDGKPMHDFLFALADEYANGKIQLADLDTRITQYLDAFTNGADKSMSSIR